MICGPLKAESQASDGGISLADVLGSTEAAPPPPIIEGAVGNVICPEPEAPAVPPRSGDAMRAVA